MSLLLDALKKAAEDKKNKTGEKPDAGAAEDDLDLDLDIDETTEYPKVDENLAARPMGRKSDDTAEQNAGGSQAADIDATGVVSPEGDARAPDTRAPVNEDAKQEFSETISPPAEPTGQAGDTSANETIAEPQPEPELEMSIDQIIEKDRSQQDKEVLNYLIHKSNQLSDSKKRRSRIIYGSLAGVVVLVLAVFSYLKLLAVSEQLYTGKPADKTDLQRPSELNPKPLVQNVSTSKPNMEPVKSTAPVVREVRKASSNAPAAKQSTALKPARQSETRAIKIVHKTVIDPTDTYLRDAYRLFNAGQYQQARELYLRVLQKEPKNRDALLGVAAVEMKQDNFESARQKYMYLLQLNPKDSIARAGLSAMPSEADPVLSESQLKLMLREQPEAAHLYFALGNIYASANQWGEAQSVFFSAWAADSGNADYAFNLAVSLDHLGKYKQALAFYQKSLLLSNGSSANISPEAIKTRIDFLQAQNE
jgi:Flp pilus assembly protein TadD